MKNDETKGKELSSSEAGTWGGEPRAAQKEERMKKWRSSVSQR